MMRMQALHSYRQTISSEQIVTIIGIGIAISLLGDGMLYIVLPTQYPQAGIRVEHVGIMLAANRAIRLFINSPYGILMERIPPPLDADSLVVYRRIGFIVLHDSRLLDDAHRAFVVGNGVGRHRYGRHNGHSRYFDR